jgi:nitronate monooxygenase
MSYLKAYSSNEKSNPDLKAFWAGQSASLLKHRDAGILIETLVKEMELTRD